MKKIEMTGVPETMIQTLYARAMESEREGHLIYDKKAMEIVKEMDYDFTKAKEDAMMRNGVVARTIVLDELVQNYVTAHPNAVVINIACGLDTRFYRMDNGKITWYNLDLPETIAIRNQIFEESGRVSTIGISALDPAWAKEVKVRGKMLFIIEGLSMYLTAEENGKILKIIKDNFDNAYILMECLAKTWVKKEGIEKSIQQTGSKFVFGADHFEELGNMTEGYHKIKDDNILRGMELFSLAYRLFALLPIAKKVTQKILIFEKD